MKLTNGEIEPGKKIGKFDIGSNREDIINDDIDYKKVWERGDGFCIYTFENFKLWFNENGVLTQIGVTLGFEGQYNNIKLGSTLNDIIDSYGSFEKEYDDYFIPGIVGLCFELGDQDDSDEWDELTAPIEWIFVYKC